MVQFKNYHFRQFEFDKKIIAITGPNGTGKTNLLDAIHYLSFTKSYFHAADSLHIQHGTHGFRIEGVFNKNDQVYDVCCILKEGMKKEFKCNDVAYPKFSQHIGLFPAVMIAPDDAAIIMDNSDTRRRWLDSLLCQLDISYLDHLIAYQKILQQRNSLLKQLAEKKQYQPELITTLNEQLVQHGEPVFLFRKKFLQEFLSVVQKNYNAIADNAETITIEYESQLQQNNFSKLLHEYRQKDMLLQRTTQGIHRDDLNFLLNEYPIKTSGSQGQRKSFLFALKLAQYQILQQYKHLSPILLLDDIFEKLDEKRVAHLVQMVSSNNFGQVFITDTDPARLRQSFAGNEAMLQLITID